MYSFFGLSHTCTSKPMTMPFYRRNRKVKWLANEWFAFVQKWKFVWCRRYNPNWLYLARNNVDSLSTNAKQATKRHWFAEFSININPNCLDIELCRLRFEYAVAQVNEIKWSDRRGSAVDAMEREMPRNSELRLLCRLQSFPFGVHSSFRLLVASPSW